MHHAYAVMVNTTHSDPVAFCLLHKFSSRLTWAVLPWTVVVLSWLNMAPTLKRSELINNKHKSLGQKICFVHCSVFLDAGASLVLSF